MLKSGSLNAIKDGTHPLGFMARMALSYVLWKGYVAITYLIPELNAARNAFNVWMGKLNVDFLGMVAKAVGEEQVRQEGIVIYLEGTRGLAIEDHCLAIPATVIFSLLIVLFPGRLRQKAWFLPVGVLLVQASNLFRLTGLMFMQRYSSSAFYAFNHSYTYVFITYGLIFLLFVGWLRFFSRPGSTPKDCAET